MALIEIYHVVADMFDVDPDWTTAVVEGVLVMLDANGLVTLATGGANTRALGVAADTLSNTTSGTPYAANIVVSSSGATRATENRVSDMFNETLASSLITVYHSGGRFASDQFVSTASYVIGRPLYSSALGVFTSVASANAQIVGTVLAAPALWPSGVPGVAVQNSMSLGTYLDFKLEI